MRLLRNERTDGTCKYALIRMDKLAKACNENDNLKEMLINAVGKDFVADYVEFGEVGSPDEFLTIKVKDINAPAALFGYATAAIKTDPEIANDVLALRVRAIDYTTTKQPD